VSVPGELILDGVQLGMLINAPFIKAGLAPYLLIIDQIIDHYSEKETSKSGAQAASRHLTGPTHSQIAKDAPDHPLYGVSVLLAEEVDRRIGTAMQAAWAAHAPAPAGTTPGQAAPAGATPGQATPVSDEEAVPVTSLVDTYVSQPSANAWWRDIVIPKLGSS